MNRLYLLTEWNVTNTEPEAESMAEGDMWCVDAVDWVSRSAPGALFATAEAAMAAAFDNVEYGNTPGDAGYSAAEIAEELAWFDFADLWSSELRDSGLRVWRREQTWSGCRSAVIELALPE